MSFTERLDHAIGRNDSLLCVGLDPDPAKLPPHLGSGPEAVIEFNRAVVAATSDLVAAYKPNYAFFGALGAAGWDVLSRTLEAIPQDVPVILDAKVGDIGNTAEQYARMFFDRLGADALTVNPFMGTDAVAPFARRTDRGVFLLCLTSNAGAADFETLQVAGTPLYELVAAKAREWNTAGNLGLVVGATQAGAIARLRALAADLPFLVPGVGAQGGDLEEAVTHGRDARGLGLLINVSRGVLYASSGPDFAQAARAAAEQLRAQINRYR
jgi:orotidine-5'-phosphate decarboxylase